GALAADEAHLYFATGGTIWSQPINSPATPPAEVRALPEGHSARHMAVGGGTIFVQTNRPDKRIISRPVADPRAKWVKQPRPAAMGGLATADRRLITQDGKQTLYLLSDEPSPQWQDNGPAPPACETLTRWGDRVLSIPQEPGPIYARPLAAGPGAG